MKILVIQMARLGDVLQTLPTIQGLKRKYPESKISFLVRETFADAAQLSPHVDKLIQFPSKLILEEVLSKPSEKQAALSKLESWVKQSFENEYDLLLNLTFSPASSFLSSLLKAKEKRGILANKDQSYALRDAWSQYFFGQVLNKNLNILHLNDLFSRIAQVSDQIGEFEVNDASFAQAQISIDTAPIYIGIQVGASQKQKTLNIAAWTVLCQKILEVEKSVQLVFFGSTADQSAISQITSNLEGRFINLAGKYRFHENTPWVRACSWVIAPDSSLVHLASLVRTKVIQLSVGGVNPHETGPYGNGHHILQPISQNAEHLAWNILQVMGDNNVDNHSFHSITRLLKCSDGSFRNDLLPKNYELDETTNFFEKAYYLLAEFRGSGKIEEIEIPEIGKPNQIDRLDKLVKAFDALCSLRKTAEFGQHYSLELLDKISDPKAIKEIYSKLQEVESTILRLQSELPLLKPLVDAWITSKDMSQSAEEQNSKQPAAELVIAYTEGAYRELVQNSEIISQLLEVSVKKAQERIATTSVEGKELKDEDLQN